jgi:kynurenine formamidase
MRIIDLSLPLENDGAWMPWWLRVRVRFQSHRFGRLAIRLLYGLSGKHLPTGLGWANETIHLSTHGTTHVDAPWHYAPTSEGRPARTIDQVPLEWCMGPGVVLDISHLEANAAASVEDLKTALSDAQYELRPGDIVLIRTGNCSLWGTRDYHCRGPGVSAEATRWLIDQGIRMMGIDAWGWDRPLPDQAREARRASRQDIFWAAHYVGVEREYCHIERLANLAALPKTGFTLCAFPLKIRAGSAGPARVVALLDEPQAD